MSYNNNNNSNSNKKPSHHVYTVRETGNQNNDFWTKIGVAFSHNDGKGFSIMLDALPVNGKMTIRVADGKKQS